MSINIVSGDDVDLVFTVKDNGTIPINLNNVQSIVFTLKKDGVIALIKDLNNGVLITDAENGVFVVSLTNADTEALGVGNSTFRVVLIDTNNKVSTIREINNKFPQILLTKF